MTCAALNSWESFAKDPEAAKTVNSPFTFPNGFYTDVRIEECFDTLIRNKMGELEEFRERPYIGAFIRVFDGKRWYTSSISNTDQIQKEIDKLASMGKPNPEISKNPIVEAFQVNSGTFLKFTGSEISKISRKEKTDVIERLVPILNSSKLMKSWKARYNDVRLVKTFYSSLGSNLVHDFQSAGYTVLMSFSEGDKTFDEKFDCSGSFFPFLLEPQHEKELKERIQLAEDFLKNAKPVKSGNFPVILSPMAAGIFAHESFGHKSEADFMIGDEAMKKEWVIGKKVGSEILTIVDEGNSMGRGFVPFDDEGAKAQKTFLVRNGILSGRLHSAKTAGLLQEKVTGNARALNFTFDPVVRMTTTYIEPGTSSKEELISKIEEGYLIETLNHGSGMSTFTLAPSRSYLIQKGKIVGPVQISVVSGTVFETLNLIDGLSSNLEMTNMATGGCGKFDQFPLPVSFGGPYVSVKSMKVQ
ncbi:MAG: TldD/PmbA family protein [Candidatus Riflebacteria bacterium]|nr:TldD/PmbA family protein [Candidatus Riflebacteria bacterium]